MFSEPPEGRGNHIAHMELIIQQVRVPWETAGARYRSAHHPSVICTPAVIALCLWFCTHRHTHKPQAETYLSCANLDSAGEVNSLNATAQFPNANEERCDDRSSKWNQSEQVFKKKDCVN